MIFLLSIVTTYDSAAPRDFEEMCSSRSSTTASCPLLFARRERAMMSSSFRRRMTWQQSLCVAPVIQLPPPERLAK